MFGRRCWVFIGALALGVTASAKTVTNPPQIPLDLLLRWPLRFADHPDFAPHYAVAGDLATDGVDWLHLCERGAHKRALPLRLADQGRYLTAWCAAVDHDFDTAFGILARLRESHIHGLPDAVRLDIATLLVQLPDLASARRAIGNNSFDLDLGVLDRTAALLADLGRDADAVDVNSLALESDVESAPGDRCMRLARADLLTPDSRKTPSQYFTGDVLKKAVSGDPTCQVIEARFSDRVATAHSRSRDSFLSAQTSNAWLNAAVQEFAMVGPADVDARELEALTHAYKTTSCSDVNGLGTVRLLVQNLAIDDRLTTTERDGFASLLRREDALCAR
ncbi:MAG TPA: hypothetical protein VGM90_33250 [Kofleriaceae bacterium]|jgi:hypothetical protein